MEITQKDVDRFEAKFTKGKANDCWLWRASGGAYGIFSVKHKTINAHRFAWILSTGKPIPAGVNVCHTCDIPYCVNPNHLWLGTQYDNMQDCIAKGRHNTYTYKKRAFCKNGHAFVGDNIYTERGNPNHRRCRTCRRAYWKAQRLKRKMGSEPWE